jgi:hypothetical protein
VVFLLAPWGQANPERRISMPKFYEGAKFAEALSSGTFKQPIVLTGLAKQAENDNNAIMFAEGTLCQSWVKIPADMIDKVEYLATITCRDHEHPLVTLYLEDPPRQNPAAGALADLLRQKRQGMSWSTEYPTTSGGVTIAHAGSGSGTGSGTGSGSGSHGCVYIPIIKTTRPPTGPEGYPADPGWIVTVEYVPVCW